MLAAEGENSIGGNVKEKDGGDVVVETEYQGPVLEEGDGSVIVELGAFAGGIEEKGDGDVSTSAASLVTGNITELDAGSVADNGVVLGVVLEL